MKRGDKIVVFVDILGFARLTEQWPRRIVYRRYGDIRMSGTSDSQSRLITFHSVLDQTIQHFSRVTNGISAMSFSDCAFVQVGNPFLSATFAITLMQHFVRAMVPVRMGMAAGTFWPSRISSDVIGTSTISRAIFSGTGIVRAHQAESNGLPGMRVFLHESIESEFSKFDYRFKVLPFSKTRRGVVGELSYLYHRDAYTDVNHPEPEDDDQTLWMTFNALRHSIGSKTPRRVQQQYIQTATALQKMRKAMGRSPFKRARKS